MKRLKKSKNILGAAVLLAVALCANAASAEAMRFLSFNIWGDYFKNPVDERHLDCSRDNGMRGVPLYARQVFPERSDA